MTIPETSGFTPGQDELTVIHNGLILALRTSKWLDPTVTTENHGLPFDREFRVARLSAEVSHVILGEHAADYSEVVVTSRTAPEDPRDPSWAGVVLRRDAGEEYHWLNPGTGATKFTVHKDRALSKVYSVIKQVPWSTVQYGEPVLGIGEAGELKIELPVVSQIGDPQEAEIMEEIARDMERITPADIALLDRAVLAVSAEA